MVDQKGQGVEVVEEGHRDLSYALVGEEVENGHVKYQMDHPLDA